MTRPGFDDDAPAETPWVALGLIVCCIAAWALAIWLVIAR